jgi:cytochrome c553
MSYQLTLIGLLLIAAVIPGRPLRAADLPAHASPPARNFEYCTVCHGAGGNGNLAIHAPRIAGLEPWYIRNQLTAFRVGWRGGHASDAPGNEMRPVGQTLTPAEVDGAIAYVGTFSPKPPAVTVSGDVEHGRTLFAACAACHGPTGQGNEALHAPALAQRTDWYLVTQLQNYRAGLRGASADDPNGQQMRAMAASLPDDAAINDVVAYIDTLR